MNKIKKIGITVLIKEPTESLFTNGIKQNAIIMRDTFSAIPEIEEVYYINLGKQRDYSRSPWGKYEKHIITFEESLEKVDLIVCACASVPEDYAELAKKRGIKLVHHIMGNEYYAFAESVIFKDEKNTIIEREKHYDAVWISPHLYDVNKSLFEVLYNCPVYVGPYVWSPQFLDEFLAEFVATGNKIKYAPSNNKAKRVSVFEPNISMVKNCITPIIIGEKLYKKHPEGLDSLNLFGSTNIKQKRPLFNFVKGLDIQKGGKIFFEDRYPIGLSLSKYSDIVLSHHQDCGLNYLYLDAAWMGYPVVHNSSYIKELGLYYAGYDAEAAADLLVECIETFDSFYEKYYEDSRVYVSKFFPTNKQNVEGYQKLISLL